MKTVLLLIACLLPFSAQAAPVRFAFTGVLDGDIPVSGSYTFNSAAQPSGALFGGFTVGRTNLPGLGMGFCPCPENGQQQTYAGALTAATVHIGASTAHLAPDPFAESRFGGDGLDPIYQFSVNGISVGNSSLPIGNDFYVVTIPLDGMPGHQFLNLSIIGNEQFNVVDDVSLPTSPPSLGLNFRNTTELRWLQYDGTSGHASIGSLTSLIHTPLPPSAVLFGAGLLALGVYMMRRRKKGDRDDLAARALHINLPLGLGGLPRP